MGKCRYARGALPFSVKDNEVSLDILQSLL